MKNSENMKVASPDHEDSSHAKLADEFMRGLMADDDETDGKAEKEPPLLERIARAWDPVGWDWYDRAEADHPAKPIFFADQMKRAARVRDALKMPAHWSVDWPAEIGADDE